MGFISKSGNGAPSEKDIASFISTGKEATWGSKTDGTLSILLTGSGANLNAHSTSNSTIEGWNRRQQTSAPAVGSPFGSYTNARYAHINEEFYYRTEIGVNLTGGAALFFGLDSTMADLGNVDPSTLLNCVGIGKDASDTNLHVIHNDGTGVATKIDLGDNFDVTLGFMALRVEIYSERGNPNIWYRVNTFKASNYTPTDTGWNELTTDIPGTTSVLAVKTGGNTRLTASSMVMQINYVSIYV